MERYTTYQKREFVVLHFKLCQSKWENAKIINKRLSTIQHIIERFRPENGSANKEMNAGL